MYGYEVHNIKSALAMQSSGRKIAVCSPKGKISVVLAGRVAAAYLNRYATGYD